MYAMGEAKKVRNSRRAMASVLSMSGRLSRLGLAGELAEGVFEARLRAAHLEEHQVLLHHRLEQRAARIFESEAQAEAGGAVTFSFGTVDAGDSWNRAQQRRHLRDVERSAGAAREHDG